MINRLCIAGNHRIAVEILEQAVLLPDTEVLCLPIASDRGVDGWQPSVRRAAERLGIRIVILEDLYALDRLSLLSAEYDRIVRPHLFRSPERLYNIHFSLLPAYRGCNTAIWPILNGETESGVTLHVMDAGIDTGPIIAQRAFDIRDLTARDVFTTCMDLGRDLCVAYLPHLAAGDTAAKPQDLSKGSLYARRDLDFARKHIDLNQNVETIIRQVRAFTFPEFQLPLLEGRAVIGVRAVPTMSSAHADADTATRAARDGFVEFMLTDTPPPPVALLERRA